MSQPSRYARVSDDEGEDVGMMTDKSTGRLNWSEPVHPKKTPVWKYVAAAAVFVALLIPAVGYTSSVMLDRRVAAAVQEALASQPAQKQNTTTPVIPSMMGSDDDDDNDTTKLADSTEVDKSNPYAGKTYSLRDCGSNADEARANGCEYDVMMQEWTPPACIDWALSEKFLAAGNWTWYADAAATKIYNTTEIALGNHDVVYVEQSYHRHHCIFTWERLVRAMRTQRPLVEKLVDYDHVMHCRMNTLKTFEEGAEVVRGVVAPTAFTKCASYDVWLKNLPHNKMSSVDRLLMV
ncbi:hypothetical protein LTR70_001736 [Exophiala xenobiotica]|uniref:Uncharacterized protein n=1 Tax=Lithohypha guttulata TaxID=1690604 RepID=A0ABR0KM44_9EURO|nr:hypothetical protein LTR24_001071 [Lithohypha guttulata]KAK5326994.1 hypothetical protein LTR70_001736 [Exophiala xenobiotica]